MVDNAYRTYMGMMPSTSGEPLRARTPAAVNMALNAFNRVNRLSNDYYEATTLGPDFERHFERTNSGSPNYNASPETRRILRNRCRYEVANNPYMRGIVDTHVTGILGRCPRLRIQHDMARMTSGEARIVERFHARWCKAVRFGLQMRQLFCARIVDGEGTGALMTNPRIRFPIKLYVKRIECDQLTADVYARQRFSWDYLDETKEVDGVILDGFGNPERYRILNRHPGAYGWSQLRPDDYKLIDEEYFLHEFREFRAGQRRGIPEIASALLPAAQLRDYSASVTKAARRASSLSVILHTDQIAEEADTMEPFDKLPIPDDMAMSVPDGWKAAQMKAEQPVDTYREFKHEGIASQGRGLGMSKARSLGDSGESNFSSARLDELNDFQLVRVERHDFETGTLSKIQRQWGMEAVLKEDYIPLRIRQKIDWWLFHEGEFPPHTWNFDSKGYMDPDNESSAHDRMLANRSMTMTQLLAERDGRTLEEHADELQREQEYLESRNITPSYFYADPGAQMTTNSSANPDSPRKAKRVRSRRVQRKVSGG